MMARQNKKYLFFLQGFSAIGSSLVSLFLPFLIARAFDLSYTQILFLWSGAMMAFGLLVFPVNLFLTQKFSTQKMLLIGIILQALFYVSLSIGAQWHWLLWFSILFYVFHLIIFWPSYNFTLLSSTRDGARGNFLGYLQSLLVFSTVLGPLISGFLLDFGLDEYVLVCAILFFVCAFLMGLQIRIHNGKIDSWGHCKQLISHTFFHPDYRVGFCVDGIQSGFMSLAWPIYLKVVLGSFSFMGIVVSIAALVETFWASVVGKWVDRQGAQKALRFSAGLRFVDLGMRIFYIQFQSLFFVGITQIVAGILGPPFNISLQSRLYEIAEKEESSDNVFFSFFVIREIFLGITRAFVLLICGLVFSLWGGLALGWVMLGVAFLTFGFRRF